MIDDLIELLTLDGRVDLTLPTEQQAKRSIIPLKVALAERAFAVRIVRAANILTLEAA